MKTHPCVQCGYCCSTSPCAYGEWNGKKCIFLTEDNKCQKYDWIVEHEKKSVYPMMGCGCSSALCNTIRAKKMIELGLDPIQEQKDIEEDLGMDLNFSGELLKELFEGTK